MGVASSFGLLVEQASIKRVNRQIIFTKVKYIIFERSEVFFFLIFR
jgi:hypothetical protein